MFAKSIFGNQIHSIDASTPRPLGQYPTVQRNVQNWRFRWGAAAGFGALPGLVPTGRGVVVSAYDPRMLSVAPNLPRVGVGLQYGDAFVGQFGPPAVGNPDGIG